jgi:hypothetical protein
MFEQNFCDPAGRVADQCPGAAVFVLSSSFQVLYMNRQAQALLRRVATIEASKINNRAQGTPAGMLRPVYADIFNGRNRSLVERDPELLQVDHSREDRRRSMRFRAFWLPVREDTRARVLIMIENLQSSSEATQ